jgi:hypothetical protein
MAIVYACIEFFYNLKLKIEQQTIKDNTQLNISIMVIMVIVIV